MKLPAAFVVATLPALSQAFTATVPPVTGFKGKAASSKEEDLMLTLAIIRDHDERSTTVSKEQFISQMQEVIETPAPVEAIDVSIPYDAAAQLAYEASDKSMKFEDFKVKYEADTVAYITAKQPQKKEEPAAAPAAAVDVSIPYDAAAKLAYEASDKSMDYASFKTKYEDDTVAFIKSKQPKKEEPVAAAPAAAPAAAAPAAEVDLSIPYDAAARLAYESSDKSTPYDDFKAKYEADAVAMVTAKKLAKEA